MSDVASSPLPVGTAIRHRLHPELRGLIARHEYTDSGALSAIPYAIQWDDSDQAYALLGWFFVYASDDTVEPVR
jgi:hypothetical protein